MTNIIRLPALIAVSLFVALPARAQTTTPNQLTPDAADAVSFEPVIFEIAPITGTLKESVQKGQQLVWLGRQGANDRRFQATNISVAFLRNDANSDVKMTFAAQVSSFGYRPVDEAKLNVIVRTRTGASIHSWNFGLSIRCADKGRPVAPISHNVPSDIAANVFNNVGTVEIADYREPNYPRVIARRCP
jgi:hypothetical protein